MFSMNILNRRGKGMRKVVFVIMISLLASFLLACADLRRLDAQTHKAIFGEDKPSEFNQYLTEDISSLTPEKRNSEIRRGVKAVIECTRMQLGSLNTDFYSVYAGCSREAYEDEKRYGRMNSAYLLGIYFQEWLSLVPGIATADTSYGRKGVLAIEESQNAYDGFKQLQRKFDLNDRELCDAANVNWQFAKPFMQEWSNK